MQFLIDHTYIGFTIWALLALIAVVGVVAYWVIRHHKMKKIQDDLEDELEQYYSDQADAQEAAKQAAAV